MKYFINAGHFDEDMGAIIGAYREGELVMGIRDSLQRIAPDFIYVPDNLDLRQSIDWINEQCSQDDIAIGIHLNANNDRSIRGTEAYFFKNYQLAKDMSAVVAESIGIPNRGPKPDSQTYVGSLGFLRQLKCNSVVLECGYMTSMLDMIKITSRKSDIAKAIANMFKVSDIDALRKELSDKDRQISELYQVINQLIAFIAGKLNAIIGRK